MNTIRHCIEVKPYDHFCVDQITHGLLHSKELKSTPEGLMEIPADTYQLLLNCLSEARWFVKGKDRDILLQASSVISVLRDKQRRVEYERREKEEREEHAKFLHEIEEAKAKLKEEAIK